MTKPSEWIVGRAREIKKGRLLSDEDDFTIATGSTIQAILDYLDAHQCKGDCHGENCECLECDIKYDR